MKIRAYDRDAAVAYAEKWALGRNPAYFSFSGFGGDCTNFASQCVYAGCAVMNFTPVTGWFYKTANDRTASWTGVAYLHNFLVSNKGAGPFASLVGRDGLLPGDLIQLGDAGGRFYHTLVVLKAHKGEIYIATHTFDALMRPLSSYAYSQARYIHIEGARTY